MNSKLKIGEVFLYQDEWKVLFSCSECGLEVEQIDHFLLHSLEHSVLVSSDEIIDLICQINGIQTGNESCAEDELADNEPHQNPPTSPGSLVEDDIDPLIDRIDEMSEDMSVAMPDEDPDFYSETLLDDFGSITPPPPSSKFEPNETSTKLKCQLCPKIFKTRMLLRRHQQSHKKNRMYTCKTCGSSMKDFTNYAVHVKRHLGIKPFRCVLCHKCFITTSELKIHMRSHTDERPYVCQMCGVSLKTSSMLALHRRRLHTKERPHMCTHCGKKFFVLQRLREHESTHTNERMYVCEVCHKSFKQSSSLSQHKQLHGEKKYTCEVCDKKFAQNAGLSYHMKSHTKKKAGLSEASAV